MRGQLSWQPDGVIHHFITSELPCSEGHLLLHCINKSACTSGKRSDGRVLPTQHRQSSQSGQGPLDHFLKSTLPFLFILFQLLHGNAFVSLH